MERTPKIDYLKCNECRADRQKCLPRGRTWPGSRCDRCEKYNYRCSGNQTFSQEQSEGASMIPRSHSVFPTPPAANPPQTAIDSAGVPVPPLGSLTIETDRVTAGEQCMEYLAYLQWIRGRMERVRKLVVDEEYMPRHCSSIKPFVTDYQRVYRDIIQRASILATDCGPKSNSVRKSIYDQLLSCCDQSPSGIESRGSILSQAAQFYETSGDYLMAQKSQELYLAHLSQADDSGEGPGVISAIRKLIELYEKVSARLGYIAERLGLNVAAALAVSPVLHRAIRQNNVLLVSEALARVGESHQIDILGRGALHCACETGAPQVVRFLIGQGFHLNHDDFVQTTPLYLAAEVGFTDGVNQLIQADLGDAWNQSDINHPRWRVLRDAVERGYLKRDDLRIEEAILISTERKRIRWGKALVVAARGGHVDIVTLIVKIAISMNVEFTLKQVAEAICVAATGGHLGVVQLLAEQGVDLDARGDYEFQAPIYHAAKGGNLHIVELLIKRGVDVNLPASNGWTALQVAAEKGHADIVEELVFKAANINARPGGSEGRTALQAAIGGQHLNIVQYLIDRGANVNAEAASYGRTALHAAAEHGNLQLLELLIEHGATIGPEKKHRSFFGGQVPYSGILYEATKGGHSEMVQRLITLGAVDSSRGAKHSALAAAAEEGNLELVKVLVANESFLESGSPIHFRGGLKAAVRGGNVEIAQFLIENNIGSNCRPWLFTSDEALYTAARHGRLAMAEFLIEMGANVNEYLAHCGEPALHAAAREGHMDIVQLLVWKGANIGGALRSAAAGGHLQIVKWLLENGANITDGEQVLPGLTGAALCRHLNIVEFLIGRVIQTDPERARTFRQEVFTGAAQSGHLQIVKLLIAMWTAEPPKGDWLEVALRVAVMGGHLSVVDLLIQNGANPNVNPSNDHHLRLLWVVKDPSIAQLLIDNGADSYARGGPGQGCSFLMKAVLHRNLGMVKVLIRRGVDVNQDEVDKARRMGDDGIHELLVAAGAKS